MSDFFDFVIKYHKQGMKRESILAYSFWVKRICHCGEAWLWGRKLRANHKHKAEGQNWEWHQDVHPQTCLQGHPSFSRGIHILNLPQTMTPAEDQVSYIWAYGGQFSFKPRQKAFYILAFAVTFPTPDIVSSLLFLVFYKRRRYHGVVLILHEHI